MRMSDEEYFRSCVAKERHLAQLLGHHNVEEFYESAGSLWENTKLLPKWTRDWQACGPLIAEYDLVISYDQGTTDPNGKAVHIGTTVVHFSDHPSKCQAIRFAIVKAVIAQLEHTKHCKH
ncbi:aminoacyl-tRNA synthetase [Herminiimonas arsenitoxidans]|jgi:hypothetical protein|uniref:aminoacyl-tRNA synthetase n=1 Tax=Herminiimonas arsenitoxidans TaxID=1809410 RepID=UPI000971327F|nr:aminoacyl-tRNA synthetase [Herminiimonas arsenitoxidans]